MKIHKLDSTDAFIAFDLEEAPGAVGIVRRARKILQDGAGLLARSTTYSFAAYEMQRGGASAGINAEDDAHDEAVAACVRADIEHRKTEVTLRRLRDELR